MKEGASLVTISTLRTFTVNLARNLDPESFAIGGSGKRRALPEQIASVGGSLEAIFEDTGVLTKAIAGTESGLEVTFTNGSNSLVIRSQEVLFQRRTPDVSGAGGVLLNLDWIGFKDDHADASAVVVELTNTSYSYKI